MSALDMNIRELQNGYRQGDHAVAEVVAQFIQQIEMRNDELRAVIGVNPHAMDDAREQDDVLASKGTLPPMFGIPVLIKDNIETVEQPTTVGSLALADNFTGRDAGVVEKLRTSGAIILGKANLSEWANFRSSRSSSGWSAIGGQCVNPHDRSRSPCGSSSGSACAVAAGLAPVAVGTETSGSVVCPASVNGIVGMKPTVGIVSQEGIVPISHSQDTAGPMTRTVADAAVMLSAMTESGESYSLDAAALNGARLGIVKQFTGYHEGVDACFEQGVASMRDAGATIIEDLEWASPGGRPREPTVLLYEFKHDLNRYLSTLPNEFASLTLEGLIRFNSEHREAEMPWFGQELFERAEAKGPLTDPEYREALAGGWTAAREDGIDRLLEESELDALIAPTQGPAWTIDQINGDHGRGSPLTGRAATAGYPHITVPMGELHGLPLGLSFVATADQDGRVLSLGHGFEQVRQQRSR